jgi:hypothetical protein
MLRIFKNIAIIGNIIFILWILRNGINEGFRATITEIVSYIGLILLLILNSLLLLWKKKQ